MESCRFLF